MHLRPPSLDHGLVSGLWGIGLGLFILLGSMAIGVAAGTAFIVAGVPGSPATSGVGPLLSSAASCSGRSAYCCTRWRR